MAAEKQTSPPPPPPQWVVDLNSPPPARSKSNSSIPDPPGFAPKSKQKQPTRILAPNQTDHDILLLKKAWETAFQPAKSVPMNAIMMYMSGNSLQIFSIMMVFMLFKTPIQGLIATNQTFARFESDRIHTKLLGVKIVWCVMQLALLAMGIWKVDRMGLLPTTRSDWLAWENERGWRETVGFAF